MQISLSLFLKRNIMFVPSQKLISFIKKSEKCYLTSYWDLDGYSIGYGHHSKTIKKNQQITLKEALNYLSKDLEESSKYANLLPLKTQGQFDAICEIIYNLGYTKLKNSTLFKYIKLNKTNKEIQLQFLLWCHANHKEVPSLKIRREWDAKRWIEKD